MSTMKTGHVQKKNTTFLAKAYQLKDLQGWISKKLVVPPARKGIAVFKDGNFDLFTSGENQVITDIDRLLGKGAGFFAGYIPDETFNGSFSVSNLLSGDNKLIDINILCEVSVDDEKRFFLDVVVPQGEIPHQSLAIDLPELFMSFASLVRNYTKDDLISGNLDDEVSQKARSLLVSMLPSKGLKFEEILIISLWSQEDRLAIEEQVQRMNQKLEDIEFERKIAQSENEEDLKRLLNESGITMPKQAGFFSSLFRKKNKESKESIKDWVNAIASDDQPGHNFRLRSLLIKKELDTAKEPQNPVLKNWWVPRAIWIFLVLLAAVGATFYLNKAAEKIEWMGRSEFYVTIWMFVLAVIIESVTKLFKQWESFFSDVKKPANLLGLDNIKFKDRLTIDRIIREQTGIELCRQRDILNELRGKIYRSGDEDLALEVKQFERKLEDFIPKLKDANSGKPVYLLEDIKLSKASWNLLMDQEEILLVKAALLTQSAQDLQAMNLEPKALISGLDKYEAELDVFIGDFIGRTRILHTQSID